MPATTRTRALELSSEVTRYDRPTLALRVDLVYFNEDGELRNYLPGGYRGDEDNALADLRITAQHDSTTAFGGQPYGWRVEFRDVFAVDLVRAEAMVKTLRKVDRGLAKLDEKWGSAQTFDAYVVRVGSVLGVKRYGYRADKDMFVATGDQYRWGDANTMIYQLNHLVVDFDKRYGAKTEVTS